MSDEPTTPAGNDTSPLDDAVAEFQRRRSSEPRLDPFAFVAAYPELPQLLDEFRRRGLFAPTISADADATMPSDPPRAPGARISAITIPGYDELIEVSRGGQGVVYRARQHGTKRDVAIKLLLEGELSADAVRRRFEREIELVAQLRHPNIVPIFHSGVTPDGEPFYVMDFVVGTPLHKYVRDRQLDLAQTLRLFLSVCDAVEHAHRHGVIHRDLKPSNILVTEDGAPRVLDFGLARSIRGGSDITLADDIMGTLPYMSPEQTKGSADVDTRTDIYALGVVLYELITGSKPYPVQGPLMFILRQINETPPAPPSTIWTRDSGVRASSSRTYWRRSRSPIDHDIETILLKALAKDPSRRYQSAGELARDLGHYLDGEAIEAKRDSFWYMAAKLAQKHAGVTATLASLVVITGVAFAATLRAWAVADQRRADAENKRQIADENSRNLEEAMTAIAQAAARSLFESFLAAVDAGNRPVAERLITKARGPDGGRTPLGSAMEYVLGETDRAALDAAFAGDARRDAALRHLALAERARLDGRRDDAVAAYDAARQSSARHWAQAVAAERSLPP